MDPWKTDKWFVSPWNYLPEVLKDYAQFWGAKPEGWSFLTGPSRGGPRREPALWGFLCEEGGWLGRAFAADVVGYWRLMGADEEGTLSIGRCAGWRRPLIVIGWVLRRRRGRKARGRLLRRFERVRERKVPSQLGGQSQVRADQDMQVHGDNQTR